MRETPAQPFPEQEPMALTGMGGKNEQSSPTTAPSRSPKETVSGAGLAVILLPSSVGPQASHHLFVCHLTGSSLASKACKPTKGAEQGEDTLLFIATIPTHGSQNQTREHLQPLA